MITRRKALLAAAAGSGLLSLQACSADADAGAGYEAAARETWRHAVGPPAGRPLLMRELVRYATLAPSSHNTQCWQFRIEERAIAILPDLARRCPAVDPDDHHLYVSLGCAAENLAQAALAYGLGGETRFDPAGAGVLRVALEPTRVRVSPLYDAIPKRQSTRAEFDGKPLAADELQLLAQAASGAGVRVLLLTERPMLEQVLDYVVRGNTAQLDDPAFLDELKAWVRFSEGEAVRSGDGLFTFSTGNPTAPRWLGSRMFNLFLSAKNENDKYARQIRSSAGVAVFVSEKEDRAHWVEAGRCYERFALQAAALGIRTAMINQPVEVAALRPQFATALGLGGRRPDLVVRFGRGPRMPSSLRRPVAAVLV